MVSAEWFVHNVLLCSFVTAFQHITLGLCDVWLHSFTCMCYGKQSYKINQGSNLARLSVFPQTACVTLNLRSYCLLSEKTWLLWDLSFALHDLVKHLNSFWGQRACSIEDYQQTLQSWGSVATRALSLCVGSHTWTNSEDVNFHTDELGLQSSLHKANWKQYKSFYFLLDFFPQFSINQVTGLCSRVFFFFCTDVCFQQHLSEDQRAVLRSEWIEEQLGLIPVCRLLLSLSLQTSWWVEYKWWLRRHELNILMVCPINELKHSRW